MKTTDELSTRVLCWVLLLFAATSTAVIGATTIYKKSVQAPFEETYSKVYKSLEESRLWVILEANIGENLSKSAKRWGEDYNRNQLEGIKVMAFCNPWYANQVSNLDPEMLALCPLRITVLHKAGTSTILFARPTAIAVGSQAEKIIKEVEEKVIEAIERAVN